MFHRATKPLIVMAVLACLAVPAQPASAQFAVVTLKSLDDLKADIHYVMEKAGQKEQADQFEALITIVTKGKGLASIDTKKPLGLYVLTPKAEGDEPLAVGFLAINKEDEFLDLLGGFNLQTGKEEKGIRPLDLPNGKTVYLRFANGHVYFTQNQSTIEGKLPNPSQFVTDENKNALVAVSLRFDEFSNEMKAKAIKKLESNQEENKEKQEGESDAHYQGRLLGMKLGKEFVTNLIQDSRDLSFSFQIDKKADKLSLDLALTAKPRSKLADQIKRLGDTKSQFAGLAQESVLNMLLTLAIPEEHRDGFGKLMDKGVQDELDKETNATKRELGQKFYDVLKPTLHSETLDSFILLLGPYKDDKVALVAGLKLKEGKKLEKFLLDAVNKIPADAKAEVKLAQARVGTTDIHLIKSKESNDEKLQKDFGSQDVFVAFRDDALIFALGSNGLEAIKDALTKLDKAAQKKTTLPLQIEVSLARAAGLSDNHDKLDADVVRKVFAGEDKNKDRVRLMILGGDSLRLRFDMDSTIIKLGAALAEKNRN